MKAIVKPRPVDGTDWPKGMQLVTKPEPTIEDSGDVLIKVFAGAVCGTDVGIYQGKPSLRTEMLKARTDPVTIGHEFSGRIVAAGPKAGSLLAKLVLAKSRINPELKRLVGRKSASSLSSDPKFIGFLEKKFFATAEMHVTCGTCYQCRLGEFHVCRNTIIKGVHDDGAWAEFGRVHARNIRLFFGRTIPPEIISFMDALGNATHTVMSAPVRGRTVAILGCGVQGLMAVAVAKWAGAKRIYVTDASHDNFTHEKLLANRFALARQYGADQCFDMALPDEQKNLVETVMSETDKTGVDAAFEMSGSYHAYEDAARILRMGGIFSLLGLPSGTTQVDFAKNIIFSGITVHGIIGRRVFETWDQMETLLRNGLAKQFVKTGFVTHRLPLERFEDGFAAIRSGDAYKVLFHP